MGGPGLLGRGATGAGETAAWSHGDSHAPAALPWGQWAPSHFRTGSCLAGIGSGTGAELGELGFLGVGVGQLLGYVPDSEIPSLKKKKKEKKSKLRLLEGP